MNFGSVCSGIEAASVAWHPLGWRASFVSEIERRSSAVLAHHYPDVPNHGDMTKFQEWPDAAIDVLVGGTPCQSFSVAGLRKGLADPRGNLMLTYGATAGRYRPRWLVWENVPGVLSSNGGRDFGTFLGMLAELGYGFAYRVLDAQYIRVDGFARAVPQRRRRVFVVGYLGDWRRAAAVLFERESLCGHPAPSRCARETIAPTLSARTRGGGGLGTDFDCDGGLIAMAHGQGGDEITTGYAPSLTCNHEAPIVAHAIQAGALRENPASGPDGVGVQEGIAYTLEARAEVQAVAHSLRGEGFDASEDGTGRGTPLVPIAFGWQNSSQQGSSASEHRSPTPDKSKTPAVGYGSAVRRLTPRECERLQGFPTTTNQLTIEACFDHQSGCVNVALSCRRWLNDASCADGDGWMPPVTAEKHSSTPQVGHEPLAAVHVLTRHADSLRVLHNRGKLIWSANGADQCALFLQPTLADATAHALVRPLLELANSITHGKAASPRSIRLSFPARNGSGPAKQSGDATEATAADVASARNRDTFTTSDLGLLIPLCDSATATLCCSVLAAIAGCIPVETLPEHFSLDVSIESDYTDIRHGGKPTPDGPRYKALGNSMAVPVMRWIGERIAAVDQIAAQQVAA